MVRSLWDDGDAAQWAGDLRQRVYSSRLLGRDPDLVLHGGGNTSVKSRHTTLLGDEVDALLVKGSGADLGDIDESGFSSLRLDAVLRLAELESLSDAEMARQLLLASTSPEDPNPSVETIVHAVLPHRFVAAWACPTVGYIFQLERTYFMPARSCHRRRRRRPRRG